MVPDKQPQRGGIGDQFVIDIFDRDQNAAVHGFEGRSSGLITIRLEQADEQQLTLSVSDDGRGLDLAAIGLDRRGCRVDVGGVKVSQPARLGIVRRHVGDAMAETMRLECGSDNRPHASQPRQPGP